MSNHLSFTDPTERQAALTAGWASVAMVLLAFFANFYVLGTLIEPGDATATFSNLTDSEGLFRAGIAGFVVVFALDVVMAWALYHFLRRADRGVSLLAAWFRLGTAFISGLAVVHLLSILPLLDADGYAAALEPGQLAAQAMVSHDAFLYGWGIGLAFFGFSLLAIGYLAYRADYAPSWLGILLALAGAGYLADSFARFLLPNYADVEGVLVGVTVILAVAGEFTWMFWLLLRGGRQRPRQATGTTAGDVREPLHR